MAVTAISIASYMDEPLLRGDKSEQKTCLYCGERLRLVKKLCDERFCGDEHRHRWRLERITRALEGE